MALTTSPPPFHLVDVNDPQWKKWFWDLYNQVIITPTDHGGLTGLSDDDHSQYIRVDGTRAFSDYTDITVAGAPSNPGAGDIRLYGLAEGGFNYLHIVDENGVDSRLSRDNLLVVRNNTGSTITKGKAVYINGSTGTWPTVALADNTSASTLPAIGIVNADIATASFGQVLVIGLLNGLDTSSWTAGDELYVGTSGDLVNTPPTGSSIVQRMGYVIFSNPATGEIKVLSSGAFKPAYIDHGNMSGLADDDHTQYALLAGRAGGQTLQGDTASGGNITIESTSHATKGSIWLGSNCEILDGGYVGLGSLATPSNALYFDQREDETTTGSLTIFQQIINRKGTTAGNTTCMLLGSTIQTTGGAPSGSVTMASITSLAAFGAAGTLSTARGFSSYGVGAFGANTTVTNNYAFYAYVYCQLGAKITNHYSYYAAGPAASGSNVITNYYGMYIADNGASAAINNAWGVYVVADISYFGGDIEVPDNVNLTLGTGQDADIYYDGTDLILDPDIVGTGRVLIGATGDDDMLLNTIEIDGDLNHDGSNIGFFGTAPAAQTAAYTQTYATATRTHSNPTASTLTDSTGGTADNTLAAVSGSGDDTTINNNFADLADEVNKLITDLANTKQVLNQVIDDGQTYGLLQSV